MKKRLLSICTLLIALFIANKYALISTEIHYKPWLTGVWHGINGPANTLLSIFTDRPVRAISCAKDYQIAWLISAIISTVAWINIFVFCICGFRTKKRS